MRRARWSSSTGDDAKSCITRALYGDLATRDGPSRRCQLLGVVRTRSLRARALAARHPSSNLTPHGWHGSGSLQSAGPIPYHDAFRATPTFILGLGNYTMRSSRVFTLMTGVALIAACSGDKAAMVPRTRLRRRASRTSAPTSAAPSPTRARMTTARSRRATGTSVTETPEPARARRTPTPTAGDYDVTVEATDDGGLTDTSDPQTVTVTAQSATSQANFDVTCTGLTCTLDNTSVFTGSVTDFEWTFGDGQTSTDEEPGSVVYTRDRAHHVHDHPEGHERWRAQPGHEAGPGLAGGHPHL